MSETDPAYFAPLTPQQNHELAIDQRRLASSAYAHYLAIVEAGDVSPGLLLWNEAMIDKSERSSYSLAAGSCVAEAALHVDAAYGLQDRLSLVRRAATYWEQVFAKEQHATNDLAERAKWALCQVPTYNAIACFMEKGTVTEGVQAEQERLFKDYFNFILERWDHEQLDGHALEALTAYAAHRSNTLRPDDELPLYSLPSPLRADHHPLEDRRVDVDIFYLPQGMKYGVQVKGGRLSDPFRDRAKKHRIYFNDARRLLCIPYTDRVIYRTMEAIVTNDPEYRDDLDLIAADHRARLLRYVVLPEYIGTSIVKTDEAKGD